MHDNMSAMQYEYNAIGVCTSTYEYIALRVEYNLTMLIMDYCCGAIDSGQTNIMK